ncbi:MAG: hypothetical protein R2697_16075 [Ilumatobacteraceae bacterium]
MTFRRRFTLADGEMTAYLDEHLDDPDADGSVAAGIPTPSSPRSVRSDRVRCARSSRPSRASRTS